MVSVVIPTLNEEKRIGGIISYLKTQALISEIIIIDDGSTDKTFSIAKESGATVYLSSMLGKGASMHDGLSRAKNENILFLDGDIFNFSTDLVEKMVMPLLQNEVDFVKGTFRRASGRVTALTAKPMLQIFFPELAKFEQPLGGIIAAKRDFLTKIKFENDYGVDVGLLIDVFQLGARICEVFIGHLDHDHQDLSALSGMASQVVRTILDRASKYQRLHPHSIFDSRESERRQQFQFGSLLKIIDPARPLALFDMDGTLIEGSYVESLTRYVGVRHELDGLLGNQSLDAVYRTEMIAQVLNGIPKLVFEKIAKTIPLKPQAAETIVELKKKGFQVGIISDSYFVATEIVRKRVFADFSVSHLLQFKRGKATGEITISPLMRAESGCVEHRICKANFLVHLEKVMLGFARERVVSIGDGENDICLFRASGDSFSINPKSQEVITASRQKINSLNEILLGLA